ncbi:hypothetical protein FT638_17285 [Bacillus cereus]|nr:hypothetical protein [Bacillus cereus]
MPIATLRKLTLKTINLLAKNLEIAKVITTDYLNEKVFNTIMAGNCGAGKTHLAYAIADQGYRLSSLQLVNCYGRLKVRSIKIPP